MTTNICLSGLTAAGKTTHALALADMLGFRFVSATELLGQLRGVENEPVQWDDQFDQIEAERDMSDIDARLDARLLQLVHDDADTVFDAWALPWTARSSVFSIWVESDFGSRVRKCAVTSLRRGQAAGIRACEGLVKRKDDATRRRFMNDHGFDIYADRSVFEAIVDNSCLIPTPTIPISNCGIEIFKSVMSQVIADHLGLKSKMQGRAEVEHYLRHVVQG